MLSVAGTRADSLSRFDAKGPEPLAPTASENGNTVHNDNLRSVERPVGASQVYRRGPQLAALGRIDRILDCYSGGMALPRARSPPGAVCRPRVVRRAQGGFMLALCKTRIARFQA